VQKRALSAAIIVIGSVAVAACGSGGTTYIVSGGSGSSPAAGGTQNNSGGVNSGGVNSGGVNSGGVNSGGVKSGGVNSGGVNSTGGSTGGSPMTSGGTSAGGVGGVAGTANGSAGTLAGGGGAGGSAGAGSLATLLFLDRFDDGADEGWTDSSGSFEVSYTGDNYSYSGSGGADEDNWATVGDVAWTDLKLDVDVYLVLQAAQMRVGIAGRVQDASTFYRLEYSAGNVSLAKVVSGSSTNLDTSPINAIGCCVTFKMTLVLQGSSLYGYVNDVLSVSATDSAITSGRIGLTAGNGLAYFDNVTVHGP
jgi:hypothetical protein